MEPETKPAAAAPQDNESARETSAAPGLSPAQLLAMEQLLAGASNAEAARKAGVARSTLHLWLRDDFHFQAALNRARRDIEENLGHQLDRMAVAAATCVVRALNDGDVKAALEVLRRRGAVPRGRIGSDDPAELQEQATIRNGKRTHRVTLAAMKQEKALSDEQHSLAISRRWAREETARDARDERRRNGSEPSRPR